METTDTNLNGLNDAEVLRNRAQHGSNSMYIRPEKGLLHLLLDIAREPMFLLLVLACGLYFATGDMSDGWIMLGSIFFVVAIEIIQEYRSEKALKALQAYNEPGATVIRNGLHINIPAHEVVVGDLMVFSEGGRLPADGVVVHQNDLFIDEAILTGESVPADKSIAEGSNLVYQGTVVTSGMGIARINAIGAKTEFGKVGKSIESIETEPTPLQKQIDRFVRQMMYAGLVAFVIVFGVNYYHTGAIIPALLFSLAFAMALIPEEIPVAFTSFMALGAYRMSKRKILVKQPKTVESLGSATVICLDKTGTITENNMSVAEIVDYNGKGRVLEYAMWSSEPKPFDMMEKAIHEAYGKEASGADRRPAFRMIHEYPLNGTPPMMTHVYENTEGTRIIAGKGAVERILEISNLPDKLRKEILVKTHELAGKGYRILGVASGDWSATAYPDHQDGFEWTFEGLVALFDPPKKGIEKVFEKFYSAGLAVKMITGDYHETALNIANKSGLRNNGTVLTGPALMAMSDAELQEHVRTTAIFARMYPEAKLRIVEALKANGDVVAMTGDGVNDGPALKAAQIGVAMGLRGTEVAKAAASMVLVDDNLKHMITALEMGRRIYANLRKAIRYIISIHVPIILVVLLPLVFGWTYLHILGPVQVIFFELIMGPTCAIAFENEPTEPNLLRQPPRSVTARLFSWRELALSLVQGIVISAGVLAMYFYGVWQGDTEAETRTNVFLTMMASNILLTLANRSFQHTMVRTLFYKNNTIWSIIGISSAAVLAVMYVPFLTRLFQLGNIKMTETLLCIAAAVVSVGWFEVYKWVKGKVKDK
jgi:Ca2+-transporting ATPase